MGLQLPQPRVPSGLLVTPDPRLHRPKRRTRVRAELRPGRTRDRGAPLSGRDDFRQDGDRPQLLERVAPLKPELRALLERCAGKQPKYKRSRGLARNLLKICPALWTFSEIEGIEPTNNRAERGLRGAVIYRKLSLGSQSEHGEQTIERLLSASQTCRLQRRSLLAYLTDLLAAKARGDPAPSLV